MRRHLEKWLGCCQPRHVALALGLGLLVGVMVSAQPKAPAPRSPFSTETLDTRYLPPPPPKFNGTINLSARDSTPSWPPSIAPRKGAPNVLLILTDDVGFGAPSTFGGVIPTPTLDRIAKMGLRYTRFHSTALCSPTRAALITGRNHHSVGYGVIAEASTGYPGYNSVIQKNTATVGELLKQNGYATSWFGKNHNVPTWEASQAGPFDRWPFGMGFDYFYGFVGGDTSQWQPNLFRNTTPIEPFAGKPGWNLTTAQADDAISHINMLNQVDPKKPFFVYYCPGGTHAPHHPTPEWVKKFKGKFDGGWNILRERIFANQKKLGVIPANAKLTPWPDKILKKWDTLTAEEQKMFARQAEVYAAYLAYTDHEIGRVVKAVEDAGKLNDTLIIYISGDNGASAEGSTVGTPNEVAVFNGLSVPVKEQMKFYGAWGSDQTYPHMAVAWSWAFDAPFKWTKQVASHFGGTRQGMCMAWPNRIKDAGGIRHQFHHVIDIVPTILDACGIKEPVSVNGTPQRPIEGVSMAYSWDKANANVPSRRKTQYFEMFAMRALYHDGWVAATTPAAPPWLMGLAKLPADAMNGYQWELYNVEDDPTQDNDLAAKRPEKLRELKELFIREATKYQVFPLDNSVLQRMITPRPGPAAGRSVFRYSGELAQVPHDAAPNVLNRSYTITAEVEVAKGAEGMLVTQGGRFGGYGLYLLKGKPVFVWNLVDLERIRWEAKEALAPGKYTLAFDFTYDGPGFGKGGTGVLKVDGKEVARKKMARTLPFTLQWDETFDVGVDTGTPVDDKDYRLPFRFSGKLNKLTVKIEPPQLFATEKKAMQKKVGERD